MKTKEAVIVVDLGFGDAGKGTMIDWLARTRGSHTVVRFNGGAQAGHNVVTADGRHHTFSQFGSASFVPGVRTHLSRFMLLSPLAMLAEERVLARKGVTDAFERTTISADALVITPFQRAANRVREMSRGDGRHGSCGMGIGETMADLRDAPELAVRAWELAAGGMPLERKLRDVQAYKTSQMRGEIDRCRALGVAADDIACLEDGGMIERYFDALGPFLDKAQLVDDGHLGTILAEPGSVLFEGAQGVLLDEAWGFHPYTTWSNCTFGNALLLLAEHGYDGDFTRLGVVRAYATRHGPGPFVTEDAELGRLIPDMHNRMDDWQRNFRVGWFDAVATRYAVEACGGVDTLAVTGLDRLRDVPFWKTCSSYDTADGSMRRIPVPRDRAAQEALTTVLMAASPVLEQHPRGLLGFQDGADAYVEWLGRASGVPVSVTSYGPTAGDKRVV